MGSFYDSIHVRTESCDSVKDVLTDISKQEEEYKFYLSPVINGWVSLYSNKYGDEKIAPEISKRLSKHVLHLLIHDDDIFCYAFYFNGDLIDEYNSRPDYFGEKVSSKEKKRLKGNPEVFRELLSDKNSIKKISKILKPPSFLERIKKCVKIPSEIKDMNKRMKSLSKEIQSFVNSPSAMDEYVQNNPDVLSEHFDSIVKELKNKGITSKEEAQKYLLESGKTQEAASKIVESFVKSKTSSKEYDFFNPNSETSKKISAAMEQVGKSFMNKKRIPQGLFSSETMRQFSEILGISNSLTSYEYLKSGEISNIKEWNKFVEVPNA